MGRLKLPNIRMKPKLISLFLLVGVLPMCVAAWVAYQKSSSALDAAQKSSTESLKSEVRAKLAGIRDEKGATVEQYFGTNNNQILTFSQDRMLVDAMREFRQIFRDYRGQAKVTSEQLVTMRKELAKYYIDEFSKEYGNQNDGKSPNAEQYLATLDDDSIALQFAYIQNNSHPLGSKESLDRSPDETKYNALHGEVHPAIRSYLQQFGYYDIFLCDPETGDIVYSVSRNWITRHR